MAPCDSTDPANWVNFPFTPGSWTYYAATNSPDVTQPAQGSAFPNCPFISALIALAWVDKDYIKTMGPGTFTFRDGGAPISVNVNNELLVSGGMLCGAVSANAFELWPSLYEKAYAKFCQYKKDPVTYPVAWLQDPDANPDLMSSLTKTEWGGNPTTVLNYLTGCTQVYQKVTSPASPRCTGGSGLTIYDYLKKCLCTDATNRVVWRSVYPAAAWTFPDGSQFTGACGIFANHCYALLGIVRYSGNSYVVLRDTFGVDPAGCNQIPAAAPWTYMDAEYNLCGTFMVPVGTPSASFGWKTMDFTNPHDAIFGLAINDFILYFEWWGYVK